MDIKQLEYFVEAMRSNSFTKAADTLYITQQGISKSIKRLEDELNAPLFTRSASAIVPTQYAEAFLPFAVEMIGSYKNGLAALNELRNSGDTELRIGVSPGLVNVLSSGALTEYLRKNPTVSVTLSEFSDDVLDKSIENDLIDIGLCITPVDESKFFIHHVKKSPTCYMLSDTHKLADKKELSLEDLKHELFMGFGTKNKGHHILIDRCAEFGFKPKLGIQTQDTHMIEHLVRKNMGVGFFVGDPNTEIPGIKIIPDSSGDWYYGMAVVTKKGKRLNNEMLKLINVLKQW